jgi:hypothetical protein
MAGHPVPGKNAQERVEHRITELHAQLGITPAERQQWDQFAEVMRENARDMDQVVMQRAQQAQSMNALQEYAILRADGRGARPACGEARNGL